MLIVDYQSKSYFRFLGDMAQVADHKTRFLITLNGGTETEQKEAVEDLSTNAHSTIQYSTAVNDKASNSSVAELFSDARTSRNILLLENSDILFDKKTAVKHSHERDSGFDLNNLFKSIAKHNGIVILSTDNKQTLSASMSTKVDVLIRFPSK
ncbi:MAG: AAA family ATPase [Psychromonas sp.]|nr:AAA family ATPase [Alteromonadales bacterium]MCP5078342.1 AAA family ATPase [Psychromonas sp.]